MAADNEKAVKIGVREAKEEQKKPEGENSISTRHGRSNTTTGFKREHYYRFRRRRWEVLWELGIGEERIERILLILNTACVLGRK